MRDMCHTIPHTLDDSRPLVSASFAFLLFARRFCLNPVWKLRYFITPIFLATHKQHEAATIPILRSTFMTRTFCFGVTPSCSTGRRLELKSCSSNCRTDPALAESLRAFAAFRQVYRASMALRFSMAQPLSLQTGNDPTATLSDKVDR